jgi:hypothetical protein
MTSDFLETLDDGSFFTPTQDNNPQSQLIMSAEETPVQQPQDTITPQQGLPSLAYPPQSIEQTSSETPSTSEQQPTTSVTPVEEESGGTVSTPILESATKTERFLLIAADQEPGPRDERLRRVIRSKYEAGLLKPYNYVKGYARLSRWMDRKLVECIFHLNILKKLNNFSQRLTRVKTTDLTTIICLTTKIPSEPFF